jgi:type II secretory pathway pseudopilin PulG
MVKKSDKETPASPSHLSGVLIFLCLGGLLALVLVPKIGSVIRQANENSNKEKLRSLRAAVWVYQSEHEGEFPKDLQPVMEPQNPYLKGSLHIHTKEHGSNYSVNISTFVDGEADTGGWGYIEGGGKWGTVWIQCTHKNLEGKIWSQY